MGNRFKGLLMKSGEGCSVVVTSSVDFYGDDSDEVVMILLLCHETSMLLAPGN